MSLRRSLVLAVFAAFTLGAPSLHAVQPDEVLKDPALEERARSLSAGLRCLVCQNQSIDDSDAPLAKDLRVLVRERLSAGDSDQEIIAFVASRYGEFVLLKPRFTPYTWVLWLATPVLLILAIGGILYAYIRRATAMAAPSALTESERAQLNRLLDKGAVEDADKL
jgi:cytochrome c-type biogenesis protein CcmH